MLLSEVEGRMKTHWFFLKLLWKSEGDFSSPQVILLLRGSQQEPRTSVVSEAFTQTLSDASGPMVFEWYFQILYQRGVFLVSGEYCTW